MYWQSWELFGDLTSAGPPGGGGGQFERLIRVEARDCAEPDCRARWNRESSQAESWKGGEPTSSAAVVPSGVVCGSCPVQASKSAQPNFTTIQTQACCCSDSSPAHSGDCTRGARAVNIVSFFLLFCCIQQVGQAVLPSNNCY